MLFTRLYNWIKYKTLPPSVLFSNRLFIERDSKHRRVTSNLGLTFRNSKWSTYARTNINLSSRNSYSTALLKILLGVIVVSSIYSFSSFYNVHTFSNPVYTLVWFVCDSDLYLKVAFSSSLLCSAQLLISNIFNKVFFSQTSLAGDSISASNLTANDTLRLPKRLHKPIFYAWMSQNSSSNLEKLFELSGESSANKDELTLFKSLFSATYFLERSGDSYPLLCSILTKLDSTPSRNLVDKYSTDLTPSSTSARLNSLLLDYSIFANTTSGSSDFFSECSKWTLSSFQSELSKNNMSTVTTTGAFYADSLSYSKLNSLLLGMSELAPLRYSSENQLSVIQWQRWLYKYNLLHRSTLKASSFMTLTKRLINSGFYSSSLSTNNIWASSALSSGKLSTGGINSLHKSIYGDFTGLEASLALSPNSSSGFLNSSDLSKLKFYETSYHWFLQRFYNLNTLSTNTVVHLPLIRSSQLSNYVVSAERYNSALNSYSLSLSTLPTLSCSILDEDLPRNRSTNTSVESSATSDVYLSYVDYTLFSKSRVEGIQNLLKNSNTSEIYFFTPRTLTK